ncbi:hypothetical protein, conserved [Angomonas deanei]|uniref:Uncharacterized protein n=1 Tax=Angomonas deanei TaxID=59799 RepID=A0A7G2CRF6_9TRYP|nr:hypothetical protein, conserved [Angomonas deanei]
MLVCAAALLLDLSCIIDDFGGYVRRNRQNERFKCCFITNVTTELDLLSVEFFDDKTPEVTSVREWAEGKGVRTKHALSIGGESGSGKTHVALQSVTFYRKCVNDKEHKVLTNNEVLIVYLKINRHEEGDEYWDDGLESKHGDAMTTMEKLCKKYPPSSGKLRTAPYLQECIQNAEPGEKRALRQLRADLCHSFLCKRIKVRADYSYDLTSKEPFEIAFFVLDEVASCPWLHKAVNNVETDDHYLSQCFANKTNFAKEYRFVCASTASEAILRDLNSTPGTFIPVTMKPSPKLFNQLMTAPEFEANMFVIKLFYLHSFFAKLIENRRCAVRAAKMMRDTLPRVRPVDSAAIAMNEYLSGKGQEELFNGTDVENAYGYAGYLVGAVAAQYKSMNGAKDIDVLEVMEIVAKGIRAFLCCPIENLEGVFEGFPQNPLELGLFDCSVTPTGKEGERCVRISVSAAQQVMAAIAYGSGGFFATSVTGGAFEFFSAAVFSLYLSGYSTKCIKQINVKTGADLFTFINSVSDVKFKGSCDSMLDHESVSGILFASHRISDSYMDVLKQFLGGENQQAFVLVNDRGAPYADLIARSGEILFLVQCKTSVERLKIDVEAELKKMGFNCEKQRKRKKDPSPKRTKKLAESLWAGSALTKSLMEALGCKVAVPIFMCSEPSTTGEKGDLKTSVEDFHVNSFGWEGPGALLFVGGSTERTMTISV